MCIEIWIELLEFLQLQRELKQNHIPAYKPCLLELASNVLQVKPA